MRYVEEACIIALLSAYIHLADVQQTAAYQIHVMAPNFTENEVATVVCKVNNSELNAVNCPLTSPPITKLRIILSDDPPSTPALTGTDLCFFSSFLTCTLDSQVSALECGCYYDGGDIYTVNVTVKADRALHENKTIDCRPNCIGNSGYGLVNIFTGVPIVVVQGTTTSITTEGITTSVAPAPPPSSPCPGWCIAVIVIGIVLFIVIIAIVVFIIKKCKTEEQQGNRPKPAPGGNNRTELTPNPPPEGNNRTELTKVNHPAQGGNKWTELTPKNAQGGNNRTELTAHL